MNLEERKFSNTTLSRRKNSKRDGPNCTYMSVRDISKIIRKFEGIPSEEKAIETQALDLFYQGKNQ
jgi:hypothetical protein